MSAIAFMTIDWSFRSCWFPRFPHAKETVVVHFSSSLFPVIKLLHFRTETNIPQQTFLQASQHTRRTKKYRTV